MTEEKAEKKVIVDPDKCIGCGTCENIAEEVFKVEDGLSHVKKGFDFEKNKDLIDSAIESCPVDAISVE